MYVFSYPISLSLSFLSPLQAATKWTEKKEALDKFLEVSNVPKIVPGDFTEAVGVFKKVLSVLSHHVLIYPYSCSTILMLRLLVWLPSVFFNCALVSRRNSMRTPAHSCLCCWTSSKTTRPLWLKRVVLSSSACSKSVP